MQMIDMLAAEIAKETPVGSDEQDILRQVLTITKQKVEHYALEVSWEKWLSLGIHMLSVTRRIRLGESLPTIDQSIVDQLSPDSRSLSRQVLSEVVRISGGKVSESEEILLSIHFDAARESA